MALRYTAADVLVVPSRYEPFGMVILEGMLYGLAIIAADVGGPAEILEHGRTGLLFPPRDVNALSRALQCLLDDPQNARHWAEQQLAKFAANSCGNIVFRRCWTFVAKSYLADVSSAASDNQPLGTIGV
jgi:glycosyltransferase involved in cell wall biosynthesis